MRWSSPIKACAWMRFSLNGIESRRGPRGPRRRRPKDFQPRLLAFFGFLLSFGASSARFCPNHDCHSRAIGRDDSC